MNKKSENPLWMEYRDVLMAMLERLDNDDAEFNSLTGKDVGETTLNIIATIPAKYSEFASATCFLVASWVIDKNKERE